MLAGGLMPALSPAILEPLWVQFTTLLPTRQVPHPLGCHRPRIPDRVIFDKLIQLLVFGCGYRRIADHTCSATTLRRRRDEWITAGVVEQLRLAVLGAYDRMLGLELEHLAVDGCTTNAPRGGQTAGPSPVDRRKQGLKRSILTEAGGIPLGAVPAPANRRDDGLLAATLDTIGVVGVLPQRPVVHLDAGYDYQPCRQVLAERGMVGQIATRGIPAPIQVGRRWVIERTHAWGNQYGRLRWCTERRRLVVKFWLATVWRLQKCSPRAFAQVNRQAKVPQETGVVRGCPLRHAPNVPQAAPRRLSMPPLSAHVWVR
jgi:transposase